LDLEAALSAVLEYDELLDSGSLED
jgi:hypothetical protein